MPVSEALTQRCETCAAVIQKHDNARWRFEIHVIRCAHCVKQAMRKGSTEFEAQFVV
jgi:NAD-dependent SIR2 family protein deacetylase